MAKYPETITHASGRPLELDATRAMLAFDPPGRPGGFDKALGAVGLVREDALVEGRARRGVNQTGGFCFVRSIDGRRIDPAALEKLLATLGKKAGKAPRLAWTGPVYRFAGDASAHGLMGIRIDVVEVIPLRPDEAKAEKALAALLKRAGLTVNAKRSKQLAPHLYCEVQDIRARHAVAACAALSDGAKGIIRVAHPDYVPLMSPAAAIPSSELHWGQQWNMVKIGAPAAWDISLGDPTVYVCVVDSGIQRAHEELNRPTSYGYEASTPSENSGVVAGPVPDITNPTGTGPLDAHGTAIASIAVGTWDSGGVAGLAGGASLFALAAPTWSAIEIELAIVRAAATPPAGVAKRVLLIGGTSNVINTPGVQAAINAALTAGVVVVCPSGNGDSATIPYPGDGTHPRIMVCGSTDQVDARYVSNYGPTLTVAAPGKDVPVADLTGAAGLGAGDYHLLFEGSSAGAAHTAGLAALLLGNAGYDFTSYPPAAATLSDKVRDVIARTAEKVGATAYNTDINSRNDELGFGRIRADHAMDFADVMIADDPLDLGVEPSTGVFWRDSDIVIRSDLEAQGVVDASFDAWHADPNQSTQIYAHASGLPCYAYVRVRNLGPGSARTVRVRAVGAACATGFMYPTDWNAAEDANHLVMTPDPWPGDAAVGDEYEIAGTLAPGQSKIVRFQISKAQADKGLAWPGSHVCGLAKVTAANDWAFAMFNPPAPVGGEQARRNNICQRNLHVVTAASPWFYGFLSGNAADQDETYEIAVEARRLPSGALIRLGLDDPGRAAPNLDVSALNAGVQANAAQRSLGGAGAGATFVLLDEARVAVGCGHPVGVVTLKPGTRFECGKADPGGVHVTGGQVVMENGKRVIESRSKQVRVRMSKVPGAVMPLYLEIPVPPGTDKSERYYVDIIQRNAAGEVVGGASLFLVP